MTVLGRRLLIADDTGDKLWEIDPDGARHPGHSAAELADYPDWPDRNDGARRHPR